MKKVRCAIYTRKSSDEGLEQSFNSLDAQREACAAYVLSQASEGWSAVPTIYDDGGISGGTLARPALQRLLADIDAGKIDIVVVYKVDRLTRSLLDFAKLVEAFDKAGTSFVSITQSFNTTTSMGRLTLNMLLSFAQFEREVTAERIRDKIAASKAKGMWMGGTPPIGYKPDGRSLAVVEEHAAIVCDIFRRYLETGNVRVVAEELKKERIFAPERISGTGRRFGGCPFSRGILYDILKNPIYVGEIKHRDTTYPAQHPPIVDRETWDAVQARLAENVQGERHGTASAASDRSLLAGLIHDEAGDPLLAAHACKPVPSRAEGARLRYRYYVSKPLHHRTGEAGEGIRIPAKEIEAAVCDRIAEAFRDPLTLLASAAIPLEGSDLGRMAERANAAAAKIASRSADRLQMLVVRGRVLTSRIEIDLSVNRIAALLGMKPLRDDRIITLTADVRATRTGRAMRLVTGAGTASSQQPDDTLIKLLQKARRWWSRICDEGIRTSQLAQAENVGAPYVTRIIRLALLSPKLVDDIISGNHGAMLNATRLLQITELPISWTEQEKLMRSLG